MVKTIGNPLTWTTRNVVDGALHVAHSVERIGGEAQAEPKIQTLTREDLRIALRRGYEDFKAARADVMFICLIYPLLGLMLAGVGLNANLLPLVFPAAAGFVLLGPFAAVGLYEVSRRREEGEQISWLAALSVTGSHNFGAIMVLGFYLIALFLAWILTAHLVWSLTLGPAQPTSVAAFVTSVLTTGAGWAMALIGLVLGFCFAVAVLATSVVSFPLLLDRNIGVPLAVRTSWQVFRQNPGVIATWGFLVAALLFLGSLPLFVGLIIVLPVLGHATWHLYRRAVSF
jgi:uncharacterized membrane protein